MLFDVEVTGNERLLSLCVQADQCMHAHKLRKEPDEA